MTTKNKKPEFEIKDELNPRYVFSMSDNRLLTAIISGEIDAIEMAKITLAGRGFNADGKYVGFKEATQELGVKQFACFWGDGYGGPHRSLVNTSNFMTGNGYDIDSIKKIHALGLNEKLDLSDLSGDHFVTRVR